MTDVRVNVDEKLPRDPRLVRLARRLGIHRQHAVGALIDVWFVAYNRASAIVSALDVDTAAEIDGFAAALCDPTIDLATPWKGDPEGDPEGDAIRNMIRLRGVERRVQWLQGQAERGRAGGRKSGESRGTSANRTGDEADANQMLPGMNPRSPALSPAPAPAPDLDLPRSRTRRAQTSPIPDDWTPNADHAARAVAANLDLATEAAKFVAHAQANDRRQVRWDAAFTAWLINAIAYGRGGRGGGSAPPASAVSHAVDLARRALERERGGGR